MDSRTHKVKEPKISVIMSVYNGMPYLREAVESMFAQTYKNFEFVIVDDASIDGTWLYLRSLKDKRIKLIKNKKNIGLALSLNKALRQAQGDYIARMDADDISMPERLERQLNFMLANHSIDICGSWVKVIDDDSQVLYSLKEPLSDKQIKKQNNWITALIHPTWFAKKEVFDVLGGYDPKWDMVEDFDFLIRAKDFKMANVGKYLLLWRRSKNRRSQKDIQKMYEKNLEIKWHFFKSGEFGATYIIYILRSIVSTYLLPVPLKIYLNKISKLG